MLARGPARSISIWLAALGLSACAGQAPNLSSPLTPGASASATRSAAAKPRAKPGSLASRRHAAAARRAAADSARLEARVLTRHAHVPLARVLARRTGNPLIADVVAIAVIREARRARLSPSLVAGVLLVENTPMDPTAVSGAGAVGLMQVMPFHAGGWDCDSAELTDPDANICHGTQVLRTFVRRSRSMHTALRRYNGCVGKRITVRCRRYPARVLRVASSIRREMLANAAATPKTKVRAAARTKTGGRSVERVSSAQ